MNPSPTCRGSFEVRAEASDVGALPTSKRSLEERLLNVYFILYASSGCTVHLAQVRFSWGGNVEGDVESAGGGPPALETYVRGLRDIHMPFTILYVHTCSANSCAVYTNYSLNKGKGESRGVQ